MIYDMRLNIVFQLDGVLFLLPKSCKMKTVHLVYFDAEDRTVSSVIEHFKVSEYFLMISLDNMIQNDTC